MENQQPKILDNPLIVRYFEDHFFGNDSAVGYASRILNKYMIRQNIYHNGPNHVWPMLERMSETEINCQADLENQFVGFFFALFHDAVAENIQASRQALASENMYKNDSDLYTRLFQMVHDAIQASTYSFDSIDLLPDHVKYCIAHDVYGLLDSDPKLIEPMERLVFKEYQKVDFPFYVQKRLQILERIYDICNLPDGSWNARKEWLLNWKPKIGIFAGTFSPFTMGHLDILKQAERNFDKVIVACGTNFWKDSTKESAETLSKQLKYHQVEIYSGLLASYLKSKPYDVTLIRGLRNGYDLQYEQNIRSAVKDSYHDLKVVYYVCGPEYAHISSTLCRDVAKYDKELYAHYTDLGNYEREY